MWQWRESLLRQFPNLEGNTFQEEVQLKRFGHAHKYAAWFLPHTSGMPEVGVALDLDDNIHWSPPALWFPSCWTTAYRPHGRHLVSDFLHAGPPPIVDTGATWFDRIVSDPWVPCDRVSAPDSPRYNEITCTKTTEHKLEKKKGLNQHQTSGKHTLKQTKRWMNIMGLSCLKSRKESHVVTTVCYHTLTTICWRTEVSCWRYETWHRSKSHYTVTRTTNSASLLHATFHMLSPERDSNKEVPYCRMIVVKAAMRLARAVILA